MSPGHPLRRFGLLAVACLLVGACKSDPQPSETVPATDAAPPLEQGAAAEAAPKQVDASSITIKERAAAFVIPAPSEIALMLQEADPEGDLLASVGSELPSYDGLSPWQAALALGIANADLLMTVPTAADEIVVARLDNIAEGMRALGSTEDQIGRLAELRGSVAGGSITREALIGQLDDLRIEMLAQGKEQYGERQVALIAVGGWARAVNLFTVSAQKTGTVPKGADVLKLRIVIDTLIEDVGADAEVQPVVAALEKIRPVATSTARVEAPPTVDELTLLREATDEILALVTASQGAK